MGLIPSLTLFLHCKNFFLFGMVSLRSHLAQWIEHSLDSIDDRVFIRSLERLVQFGRSDWSIFQFYYPEIHLKTDAPNGKRRRKVYKRSCGPKENNMIISNEKSRERNRFEVFFLIKKKINISPLVISDRRASQSRDIPYSFFLRFSTFSIITLTFILTTVKMRFFFRFISHRKQFL